MPGRDPDDIQREIDRTRTELASTIDTIADRVNPKRVADRGKQAVRSKLPGQRSGLASSSGFGPTRSLPEAPGPTRAAAHAVEGGLASVAGSPPPYESITGRELPAGQSDAGSSDAVIRLPRGVELPRRQVVIVIASAGAALAAAIATVIVVRRRS